MDLEHERRLTDVEARSKSNTKRLDDLETLAKSVATLAEREARMETDVQEIKADVKTLAAKPGKKWESMEEKILVTIVGALAGFLLAQLGIG